MSGRRCGWKCGVLAVLLSGWAFQLACARNFQREIEVLLAPQANPLLIRDSALVRIFGVGILQLFNN